MSDIGPELPPHLLAKRKRKQEESAENERNNASGASQPDSPANGEKRRRVLGPSMPPAPMDERPSEPADAAEDSSSDEDDGFGPALPTHQSEDEARKANEKHILETSQPTKQEKLKRDEWMMVPPKQDDLAARMDPTKIRARGFNTGKSARAPNANDDDNSAWHETPEQKQKRLADEMMGVSKLAGPQRPAGKDSSAAKDEATARKTKEQIDKTRGPSLMDRHKQTTGPEADDDPSKRSFDREKDMGSGMRINHTQRQQMLNKAAGFDSKFSGGSYL